MPSVPNTSLPLAFQCRHSMMPALRIHTARLPQGQGSLVGVCFPEHCRSFSPRNGASQLTTHYQVMGKLLDELEGPKEQCGPTDTLLHVLSAVSTGGAQFRFCPRRPKVPTDAQALYSQALCRLLTGAQELHHQILERTRKI